MSRHWRVTLLLVPLALVVIIFIKISQFREALSSIPDTSFVFLLARKPAKLLVLVSGLLAPMPLCLAAAIGFRKEQQETDEVGNLMVQLVVLVGVELSAFFGLVALVRVTAWTFLATQAAFLPAGIVVLRLVALRRVLPEASAALAWRSTKNYLLIVLAMVTCGLASMHFGRDFNYDFINYHYYIGHAFLNHRDGIDFDVSDLHTYFNPLLDAAYVLVIQNVKPVWVGFIVGSAHGIVVVLLYGIAHEVFGRSEALRAVRAPLAVACAIAGVCEPLFLAQLGTTFHDNLLAAFVLASLLLVVRLVGRVPRAQGSAMGVIAALAGALVGMAAGFKLTTATYAVGLVLVLPVIPIGWRCRLGLATACVVGMLAGFLLSNGFWMAHLFVHYQNPFFPFYNALFKSPYWWDQNLTFLHVSSSFRWFDHLLVPFYFAGKGLLLSEDPARDLRLAAAYVLLLLVLLGRLAVFLRADRRSPTKLGAVPRGPLSPDAVLLISFVVASYLVWYVQFRVPRYLVTIKVLAPLVCVLLLLDLCRTRRQVWIASTVLLLLMTARIDVPSFGRRDWSETFLDYKVPRIENVENGVVLLINYWESGTIRGSAPFAAVVPMMPQCMRYIKIDSNQIANYGGTKPLAMEQQVLKLVRAHRGPIYLLAYNRPTTLVVATKALEKYDLALAEGQHPTRITGWYTDLGLWPLTRRSEVVARSPAPGKSLNH